MNKTQFSEAVTDLIGRTRAGDPELVDRQKRIKLIDELIESYVITTDGKTPESYELERLGSLILHEELSSTANNKMKTQEYPPMSERWEKSRHDQERSFKLAEEIGVDRRDYRKPVRRTI